MPVKHDLINFRSWNNDLTLGKFLLFNFFRLKQVILDGSGKFIIGVFFKEFWRWPAFEDTLTIRREAKSARSMWLEIILIGYAH